MISSVYFLKSNLGLYRMLRSIHEKSWWYYDRCSMHNGTLVLVVRVYNQKLCIVIYCLFIQQNAKSFGLSVCGRSNSRCSVCLYYYYLNCQFVTNKRLIYCSTHWKKALQCTALHCAVYAHILKTIHICETANSTWACRPRAELGACRTPAL
jgi:hypothetical protein